MNDVNLTPEDRAAYPLTCGARETMAAFAERTAAEIEESLRAASRLEKRALSIRLNMTKLAKTFLCYNYVRVPMTEQIAGNRRRFEREGLFDAFVGGRAAFDSLTEDERAEWIQFAGTSFMLHRAFLDPHLAKLGAAKADGSPRAAEQIFESRIVLGTLYGILREWRTRRRERNLFPFEYWTYEDEPWRDGEEEDIDGE